eukprot:5559015-Prymnesium_polylepis.1
MAASGEPEMSAVASVAQLQPPPEETPPSTQIEQPAAPLRPTAFAQRSSGVQVIAVQPALMPPIPVAAP